jgi:hypothetical protein
MITAWAFVHVHADTLDRIKTELNGQATRVFSLEFNDKTHDQEESQILFYYDYLIFWIIKAAISVFSSVRIIRET